MIKILIKGMRAHPKTAAGGLALFFTLCSMYWFFTQFLICP